MPASATEREPVAVDLSSVPGARLVAAHAWTLDQSGSVYQLNCVAASSAPWVTGLEGAVLDGATALMRKAAGLDYAMAGPVETNGHAFERAFSGSDSGRHALGRHWLGFTEGGAELVLCSGVCLGSSEAICQEHGSGFLIDGQVSPPPPRGWFGQLVAGGLGRPEMSYLALALTGIAVASVLLKRRPTRWRWPDRAAHGR
ncbi:hypothetical protein JYT22_00935 [Endomicrobium sp. AH-315-J14]|nr:hypothetical protein [Endomicrobium sp. AH-315-J14]